MPTAITDQRPFARAPAPPRRIHRGTVDDRDHPASADGARAGGGCRAWIRAARIRQWTKNLLVFAAPAAAGISGTPTTVTPLLMTFFVFCLLATGTYLVNDVQDADEDRRHPVKCHRPIASGALAPGRALVVAGTGTVFALMLAITVNAATFAAACAYVLLNAAYTLRLRRIAVVEMVAISGAFVIRAIAGATAAGVPASRTFIAVVALGALFVAAGKRYADFIDPSARRSRAVLKSYSRGSLKAVIAVACAATLWTYYLWAFGPADSRLTLAGELTIIPFTFSVLRYALIASGGGGGAPENVLFSDRHLQLLGLIWLLLFAAGD